MLVRRVLGRAEQRKQCPGQMETLERLRGVREHVQEEEESFIAEVTIKTCQDSLFHHFLQRKHKFCLSDKNFSDHPLLQQDRLYMYFDWTFLTNEYALM